MLSQSGVGTINPNASLVNKLESSLHSRDWQKVEVDSESQSDIFHAVSSSI